MKFLFRKKIPILCLLACIMPAVVFALAPVEDASMQQGSVETGQLVPPASSSQQNVMGASNQAGTATVSNVANQQLAANTTQTQQQTAEPQDVTENNPIVGNVTNPTLLGDTASTSSLSLSQRVLRLEQQMHNMINANNSDQISQLQQQLAQLSGKIAVQEHDITLLNSQLRSFYQDLSTQIKQVKNMAGTSTDTSGDTLPDTSEPADTSPRSTTTKHPRAHTPVKTSDAAVEAANTYKSALSLLMHKKYAQSARSFQSYLDDFPNGRFVVNAHYWLGEISVQQRNLHAAINQFNIVVKQFPRSNKVADAKVKLAIIHSSQGLTSEARGEFMRIRQRYPGTTAAQLASIQLQQLGNAQ
ncbi:MAG: tol-pal system protein YbgF [Coxiella sp. (in: Bacteria)]|nr:MAG: tol-pal system protein YbgF [Coxiella sp. (in: g-proteobacteria)]